MEQGEEKSPTNITRSTNLRKACHNRYRPRLRLPELLGGATSGKSTRARGSSGKEGRDSRRHKPLPCSSRAKAAKV